MEGEREISEFCFTSAMTLAVNGCEKIPERYILPPLQRPNTNRSSITLPVIDLPLLNNPLHRSRAVNEIHSACRKLGFFQVINHGIPASIMEDALETAKEFFHLPSDEKMQFASGNVREPVRYGTSLNHSTDKVFCWRDFLKHYANPFSEWIHFWPGGDHHFDVVGNAYSPATAAHRRRTVCQVLLSTVVSSRKF